MRSAPTKARRCAHPQIRSATSAAAALLAWIVSPLAARAAQDDANTASGDVTDAITLMRVADDAGDLTLEARLRGVEGREAAVVAARASVFAAAPERLIPVLAALACGRDPELAPEAAAALAQLGARLGESELSAREALRADLRDARASLACPAQAAAPRLDVVLALQTLAAVLDDTLAR